MLKFNVKETKPPVSGDVEVEVRLLVGINGATLYAKVDGDERAILTLMPLGTIYRHVSAQLPGFQADEDGRIELGGPYDEAY